MLFKGMGVYITKNIINMPPFCKTCVKIASESTQVPRPKIKQAGFNIAGNPPRFCKTHATSGMVCVKKTCEIKNCPKSPYFNEFGQTQGRRCYDHKLDNMVNVTTKKCEVCVNDPKYIPSETNPAPKIPFAKYGGKFCIEHRKDGMKTPHKRCEFADCDTFANFNIIGNPPKYCYDHGKLILGDACVDVATKRCKHGKRAAHCTELNCMGSQICMMCCERQRNYRCKYTYKPDPNKDDFKTTTLCGTCYNKVKLGDLLIGKTPAQAMKILKRKTFTKMKEAQVLKSIIEAFFDKTWNEQSYVPTCDMKLTKQRYFTDLELDIGALYKLIFENDEHQHKRIACEMQRMNNIIAANNGRHLVFVRFNPDSYKYDGKKYPSMFNVDNEPTEIYADRMPRVVDIIDSEIQRAALLEQSTDSTNLAKDSLIRIVFINYDDNSPAIIDAVKMVGEDQVVVYYT